MDCTGRSKIMSAPAAAIAGNEQSIRYAAGNHDGYADIGTPPDGFDQTRIGIAGTEGSQNDAMGVGPNARIHMYRVTARVDCNDINPHVIKCRRKARAWRIFERPRLSKSVGNIGRVLIKPPSRQQAAAETDEHAAARIGRIDGCGNGRGEIARPVCRGMISGKLRTGKHDGLNQAMLQMDKQRRLFHGVRTMQNDDATDGCIAKQFTNLIADLLHVGERQARRILCHQFDGSKIDRHVREQCQQALTRQ